KPALARRSPSGLKQTVLTSEVCPLRLRASWLVCASQTFTVRSSLALARRLPSGLKHTLTTPAVCPLGRRASWPVCASHTFIDPSSLPQARRLPSGLKQTLWTLVFPCRVRVSFSVCTSHTFIVPSWLPPARLTPASRLPSGLKHTLRTKLQCTWRERVSWPVCASHTVTSPCCCFLPGSSPPPALARRWPSGLKHTLSRNSVCPLRERVSWPVCASHTVTSPWRCLLSGSYTPRALARRWPSGLKHKPSP